MFKFICTILMASITLLSSNVFAEAPDSMNAKLTKIADEAIEKYKLPGLAITVRLPSNQWVDVYQGHVSKDSLKSINENTLFQVGSTTKTFTAALILKLVEKNKLSLNDHIGKWLPEYPKWSQISVLQLLNHTSGIYDYIDVPLWWIRLDLHRSKIWTSDELVNLAYSHPLYFPIGSGWHYSNTDYVLLGMIVEKITKSPFKAALNHYVLNSMSSEMKHTYYVVDSFPPIVTQNLAQGYRNGERDMTTINTSWLQAGGALISNAHDLTCWYWNVFSGHVVTESMLKKMVSFVSLKNGRLSQDDHITGYGLGVFSMPTPYSVVWFTPGLTPGYTSLVAWIPCKGIAFSYTTNNTLIIKGFHSYLIEQILKLLLEEGANDNCVHESKAERTDFPKF